MPIRVLDDATINKIAAGEVVERPLSVVKELVENALDAGASALTVEIREGGHGLIRVTDNGCGIAPAEVRKAFLRHATSKITRVEDLDSARTLGFRGEALASVAAVARVEMITKTEDALTGVRLVMEGGREVLFEEVACPTGTTIRVENLFYNVPARLKFLKKPATEGAIVTDFIQRLIMARPDKAIRYLCGSSEPMYVSSGNGSYLSAIATVYGRDITSQLMELKMPEQWDGFNLRGFISKPALARANRSFQTFLVNGRWIRSALLEKSVAEAYKDYLVPGTFPVVVVYLDVDPTKLDVNVHPAKMEVRFAEEALVRERVIASIGYSLRENLLIHSKPEPVVKPEPVAKPAEPIKSAIQPVVKAEPISVPKTEPIPAPVHESEPQPKPLVHLYQEAVRPAEPVQVEQVVLPDYPTKEPIAPEKPIAPAEPPTVPKPELAPAPKKEPFDAIRLIGQVFETYWIFEADMLSPTGCETAMYMMDQHAAHERVLYDRFRAMLANQQVDSQMLMEPVAFSINPKDAANLEEYQPLLARLGFEVERFGEDALVCRAVPYIFNNSPEPAELTSLVEMIAEGNADAGRDLWLDRMAMMSCKAAVKGDNVLSVDEAKTLIHDLFASANPYNCPHGRPTVIQISKTELEKRFKRIM